jgi:adenine-specific DNA-methyltransferase
MNKFNKTRLELTWTGKENQPNLEPRILLQDLEKSYHAPHRATDKDTFDNKLVFGDNLFALWLKECRQKKWAILSDHPIAIAISCFTCRPFPAEYQAPF